MNATPTQDELFHHSSAKRCPQLLKGCVAVLVATTLAAGVVGLPDAGRSQEPAGEDSPAEMPSSPQGDDLYLTVPKMGLHHAPVANAVTPQTLSAGAAKITSTGFPWQENANTYITGHVYGYRGTPSWQQFADLPDLERGDSVTLTDSRGTDYHYEVVGSMTVEPSESWVTYPVPGRDLVTLQTCVGPEWSERLVVRAQRLHPGEGPPAKLPPLQASSRKEMP